MFLAYASHELRGELTLVRTLAEVALADPNADAVALRRMAEGVVAGCQRQERMLEALLTLARSEDGQLRREPVNLATTAATAMGGHDHRALRSTAALTPARTTGDPQLIERLIANLVSNAIRHNIPGGRIDVATCMAAGRATFKIANTGPAIRTGEIPRLFRPFERLSSGSGRPAEGVGLGLAIVQAIANAHEATVSARARTGGGLAISVAFPAVH
jgi:signal transduction histidine kinase